MPEDTTKSKKTPAYVSYQTFKNVIRSLAGHVPERLDSSVFPQMSGSSRSQLFGALRFFGLIDERGTPSTLLRQMAAADETKWNEQMADLVRTHYPAQVKVLAQGTPQLLRESFADVGTGVLAPAYRFLLAACKDTGIPISKTIANDKGSPNRSKRRPPMRAEQSGSGSTSATGTTSPSPSSSATSIEMALLDKFPEFNPDWGAEQQMQWFEAFQKLLALTRKGGAND